MCNIGEIYMPIMKHVHANKEKALPTEWSKFHWLKGFYFQKLVC